MRKKTKQPVDVAAVADAWEILFKSQKANTIEGLAKLGWIDAYTLSIKLNIGRVAAINRMKKLGAENKKFSVMWDDGKTRSVNFFRLK